MTEYVCAACRDTGIFDWSDHCYPTWCDCPAGLNAKSASDNERSEYLLRTSEYADTPDWM